MMKRVFIFSFLLLSFLPGRAQRTEPYQLSISDFYIQDTTAKEPSYLHIQWKGSYKTLTVGQTRYRYTEYSALVGKSFSWIRVDQDKEKQLAINQILYDQARSIARATTDSLLFMSLRETEMQRRLNRNYLAARKIYLETGIPPFPTAVDKEIDISAIKWESTQKGGGLSFSLSETFLLMSTPDLSTPITSLLLGYEFFRHHSALFMDASYGFGQYSGRYSNVTGLAHGGDRVPYWALSCQYAYQIPCLQRGKFSVFSGIGYTSIGLNNILRGDRKSTLQGLTFSEGIAFDCYSRSKTVDFRGPRHDLIQKGLRIKFFTSQILTFPQRSWVPTLNLGLGYVFSVQGVKPGAND